MRGLGKSTFWLAPPPLFFFVPFVPYRVSRYIFENLFKNFLNSIPSITGTVTIKNISRDKVAREMSLLMFVPFNNSTEVKTINGIVITHNKLIIAVSDIERATSPLAKEVNTPLRV